MHIEFRMECLVLVLLVIVTANAQDQAFGRNFRRRTNDRQIQPEPRRLPESVRGPGDRQVDVVPLERFGDSAGQTGRFKDPQRGSFEGDRRSNFDDRRGDRFDRNPPPPPPDIFPGPKRDPQSAGGVDGTQGQQFDSSRDRRFPPRDRDIGPGPANFDGRNFGPEPRRDRFSRGQLETSNRGSLDVGGSMNLGVDVQLEGPSELLGPAGSSGFDSGSGGSSQRPLDLPNERRRFDSSSPQDQGRFDRRFDSPRDSRGQFDRSISDRQASDRRSLGDTRQGRFDQTTDPRFDTSNRFGPTVSQFDSPQSRDTRQDAFAPSGTGRFDVRSDRGVDSLSRNRVAGPQDTVGTPGDGGVGASRQEAIGTLPAGQMDRQSPRPNGFGPADQSQPTAGAGGFRPADRFAQGQFTSSDKAQLDAAGQGEVLIEGEIQVPKALLKAVQNGLASALGGVDTGTVGDPGKKPTDSTGLSSNLRPEQASSNPPGRNIQDLNSGASIDGQGARRLDGSQQGQATFGPPQNMDRQGPGRFDGAQQSQLGPSDFDTSGRARSTGPQRSGRFDGPQQSQGGFDSVGTARFDGPQRDQRGFDTPRNIGRQRARRLDGSEQDQGRFDGTGNMDRQVPGRLDSRRQDSAGLQERGISSRVPRQNDSQSGMIPSDQGPRDPYDNQTGSSPPVPGPEAIQGPLTDLLSVNVRCYADPMKGLSCGVEYPDDQCKEKWDFPNPCTRENMEVNITKFVHPYDNSKFLMCGEMGKLYIVQCPRLEIFHAGCGQCVDENVGLTASCEEPLPPQTSNPCTRQNIIDNKLFFGFPGNLSKFIHCDVWGKPWVRECTRGEVWNQWAVACVQPALVNPCSRLNADLAYLYPHPCDPKKFIRCDQQGVAYEDACGWNEAFNEATQYCDPIGSFYGSDRQEFCEGFMFGFKQYRDQGVIDPGFIQGRGQLGSPNNTPGQGGVDVGTGGGWQANIRNRGPDRTDTGLGVNGKPISPTEGVTNLAGTITIHRSKLRTYVYKKNEQYAQPCVIENIKEGRYHFRVTGDPHSFIQCDDHGFSHKITCPGPKIGPKDYFDPWTNTCVDGPIHEDYRFSR